jgi:hypothetical protein
VNSSVGVKISVRETISDTQRHSEALRSNQRHSVALRGHSVALRSHQRRRTKPTCEQLCRQLRIRLDMLRRPLAEFRQCPIGEPSHHRRLGIICTQGAGGLASEHLWGRARRRGEHLHAVRKAPVASPRSTCGEGRGAVVSTCMLYARRRWPRLGAPAINENQGHSRTSMKIRDIQRQSGTIKDDQVSSGLIRAHQGSSALIRINQGAN